MTIKAEQLIDQYLSEQLTRGMKNAYSKLENNSLVCKGCQSTVPKYPGRYPSRCPHCGDELEAVQYDCAD